jgi:SAM-dependent methyltransferase
MSDRYIDTNRDHWDRSAADYQELHADQLRGGLEWGVWSVPEARLNVLGDVAGKDVLELGCGAAQWSLALARSGARVTGIDLSDEQLRFARDEARRAGVELDLVCGNAERTPFEDASFDVVFCDHGAMTFADPRQTVPEAARLLRTGGLFAFNMTSPLLDLCWDPATEVASERLHETYFGMHRLDEPDTVSFNLPYGEWIRLFRANGLRIEDLIEIRPNETAMTTYEGFAPRSWARRWPAENVWKLVRE